MTESQFRADLAAAGFTLGDREDADSCFDGMGWEWGTRASIHGHDMTIRHDGSSYVALVDDIDDTFSADTAQELAGDIFAAE